MLVFSLTECIMYAPTCRCRLGRRVRFTSAAAFAAAAGAASASAELDELCVLFCQRVVLKVSLCEAVTFSTFLRATFESQLFSLVVLKWFLSWF